MIDSNSDPEGISYIIPSNDDATKSIALIVGFLAENAIKRGKSGKKAAIAENRRKLRKNSRRKRRSSNASLKFKITVYDSNFCTFILNFGLTTFTYIHMTIDINLIKRLRDMTGAGVSLM